MCPPMPTRGKTRYLIIYSVNLLLLTNECQQRSSTDYALGVAHNTSHILRLFPRLLRLHIGMCSRRSSNGLILPVYTRFHPSYCWTKIAPPVPSCNSPFYNHSSGSIGVWGCGCPSLISVCRIEMAVFALMNRAPSSASAAGDMTARIICKTLRTAPLLIGILSFPAMNMWPPARLRDLGSERYDTSLWIERTMSLAW